MKTQRGFTIIELMITILLLGVMATIAVPSFSSILKQNRLSAQTNTILSTLNYARSETINQSSNVVITPIEAGNWSSGWLVRRNSATGTVLRTFEGFKNSAVTSAANTITYQSDGTTTGGGAIMIDITPTKCETGEDDVRRITISPSGQSASSHQNCS